jgi:signal peptidase I
LPGEELTIGPEAVTVDGRALKRRSGQVAGYQRQNLQGDWVEQRYQQATETIGQHQVSVALDLDPAKRRAGQFRVPPGHVFLLGDNRIHAQDSRSFGPVPLESVQGVVLEVWFSRDPLHRKFRPERRGLPIP